MMFNLVRWTQPHMKTTIIFIGLCSSCAIAPMTAALIPPHVAPVNAALEAESIPASNPVRFMLWTTTSISCLTTPR